LHIPASAEMIAASDTTVETTPTRHGGLDWGGLIE
jgi:hypothetical protein